MQRRGIEKHTVGCLYCLEFLLACVFILVPNVKIAHCI